MMTPAIGVLLEPLAYAFMREGLIAAVMVGLVCAVLSCLLVVRHEAMLGDAISHAVLLGVAIGFIVAGTGGLIVGALVVAILTGLAITYLERNTPIRLDAAMGTTFTATFALGLAIISVVQPRGIDLFHVLFGNVLGLQRADLILTVVTGLVVLVTVAVLFRWLHVWSLDAQLAAALGVPVRALEYVFTALLSAVIVASMKAVGLLLVVAMLIIPGATALLVATRLRTMMLVASLVGVFSAVAGLYGSFYVDVASGPAIVLTAAACFVVMLLVSPANGALARWWTRRQRVSHIVGEDLLKHLVKSEPSDAPSPTMLTSALGKSRRLIDVALRRLERADLVVCGDDSVRLTTAGHERALEIVRAHRLLEQYAREVDEVPLSEVHHVAEEREHQVDVADLADAAYILGEPSVDPHGHLIPSENRPAVATARRALREIDPGVTQVVQEIADDREDLVVLMIRMGLLPGAEVTVIEHDDTRTRIATTGGPLDVPREIADRVYLRA